MSWIGRTGRLASLATLTSLCLIPIGCNTSGHGKHTSEGVALARERMDSLKAANTWEMARQQFFAGDLGKALKSVNQSIDYNGAVPKSITLKGRILIELGQIEQSITSFREALATDPSYVDAHYFMGVAFERFSSYEEALEQYEAALTLEPSDPQYPLAAAEMMIELNRLDQAQSLLESKKASFTHNAGVRQTLGHIAMMRREPEKAVTFFDEARLLAPDEPAILEDLALAQIASSQFAQAEYSIRRLLAEPDYADRRDLKQARARCLIELDRPAEARSILLSLTSDEMGQSDVQLWTDLGNVAIVLGDMHRLRIVASRLQAMAPDDPRGDLLLAMWHKGRGDLEAALKSVDRAMARASDDPTPHLLRGLVLSAMGRNQEAAESFAAAVGLDPTSASARKMLASVESDE